MRFVGVSVQPGKIFHKVIDKSSKIGYNSFIRIYFTFGKPEDKMRARRKNLHNMTDSFRILL